MEKEQIQELINSNSLLKRCYTEFKKKYSFNKIIDMYTQLSMTGMHPDYAFIKYEFNGKVYKFEYEED